MAMTPEEMRAAIVGNLTRKTGRTLEQWVELVRTEGPGTRKERVAWLKENHWLGQFQAEVVADQADRPDEDVPPSAEELIAAQYAGMKGVLRPIYDRLAAAVEALGSDVALEPRKSYVSLIRRRQFGIIQPSTRTRVDLGLVLPGVETAGRLQPAGSLGNERLTHRVALPWVEAVDEELIGWIRRAYEADR
jgi:hypothetical protein